ncbi:MAG: methionine--tRNA ligase [Anaerolineaceae bacterium]|nr:methionine--tRNA ligase [Anaerolineaceae bacterium]
MTDPFYITTPIYYVNDEPHLGHAYTTILADVLARYARLQGQETFFLTGTDEHGQKVQDASLSRGVTPLVHADEMVVRFQHAWKRLNIAYDDFIRTTEPRHTRVVAAILQDLWDKGEIYKGEYEGWYCIPDERYWMEKDLVDGNCPECGRDVKQIVEPNYFFKMSTYQEWLVGYISENPSFIQPEYRRNEVLGFLRQPLGDLCISRPVSRLNWGIPLPFDPEYVTYVWFDALINYVTASGYLSDEKRFARLWPRALHLIGKDILTTHCVYWPTMLKAAGLPQPKTIFAHGWWIMRGTKMSKSLGNVIKPLDLADVYGVDAFRYFLMRDMSLGRDADFDEERLNHRYQGDLVNDLGNLLHRLVNMIERYCDGCVPPPSDPTSAETDLRAHCETLPSQVFELVESLGLNNTLEIVMEAVREINRYLEHAAPWSLAKAGQTERTATVLYHAAEALRLISLLLYPVMPERMAEVWHRLGWQPPNSLQEELAWGRLQPGSAVTAGPPLFPRELPRL